MSALGHSWPRPDTQVRWQEHGACKDHPELNWFPARGEPQTEQTAVCRDCPVMVQCLAFALSQREVDDFGIWGGTSAKQRTAIRRRRGGGRRPAECGTRAGYMRHQDRHEPICDACRSANNAYKAEHRRVTLAGRAQPSPKAWHCAHDTPGCRRAHPCSDECRILPDPIPTPPEANVS